jgi:hypothetical protein
VAFEAASQHPQNRTLVLRLSTDPFAALEPMERSPSGT